VAALQPRPGLRVEALLVVVVALLMMRMEVQQRRKTAGR
jgi:hypothetical protein